MMKKLLGILAVCGIATMVFAAANGYFRANSDGTIDVVASGVEVADATISDDLSVADTTTLVDLAITPESLSVTNGAEDVAMNSTITVLTGIGGANDTTNTITLEDPSLDGLIRIIAVSDSSTNLIRIADGSGSRLAGDWIGDNDDTLTLFHDGVDWVEITRSDN